MRTAGELEALDRQHTGILSRLGLLPSGQMRAVDLLRRWLAVRLERFSPAGSARDPYDGAPLRERDNLAKPASEGGPPHRGR